MQSLRLHACLGFVIFVTFGFPPLFVSFDSVTQTADKGITVNRRIFVLLLGKEKKNWLA